jgi:integrase
MKLRKMTVVEHDAAGGKTKRKSLKWYAVFVDFNGILQRLPLCESRRDAQELARAVNRLNSWRAGGDSVLPAELVKGVEGLPASILKKLTAWDIVPRSRINAIKPLVEHVADWRASLLAKGNTAEYAALSAYRVLRVVTGCRFATLSDVSASKAQQVIAELRQDRLTGDKTVRGIGASTFNSYIRDCRSFFRWMVRDGRALQNPLLHLQGVNARTDRRHDRRALSVDELRWLLEITATGPDRYGMSGTERAMLYRLAVESGLRSAELRSLTRGSFQLEGDTPTVVIAAAYAKNRRQDVLPLKMNTAAALAVHLAGKMSTAPAFAMPKRDRIVEMMQADLAAARTAWIAAAGSQQERTERGDGTFLAYRDDVGRCADFHALRHTFISNLAAGGVHPKTAQRLARHSTITLTMDRYTHLRREDLAGALKVLPDFTGTRQTAIATGTDEIQITLPLSLPPNGANERNSAQPSAMNTASGASEDSPTKTGETSGFPSPGGGSRTRTTFRSTDFKSVASAVPPRPGWTNCNRSQCRSITRQNMPKMMQYQPNGPSRW